MQPSRQLAAIMFTDMVGFTTLMQQNEALARQQRDKSKAAFEESLAKFEGTLLQYYGDGTLSIFKSAANAVQSAIEMQTICRQENVDLRIGLHSGDVMFDETGVYGDSVNVASRLESLAVPGSIFISEKLYDEIRNQNINATPLGYFELKNVQKPMQVFAVSNPGIVVPSRDEVKGKVKQTLNAVAVLPFSSLSSDPENEFFCDGITEELLNVLAKIEDLQVTSRTSSFAFKGKNEDVREIAAKLNVQKILEGSVRKSGNKVRITAQLINAADGYHIWSETYNRSIDDIFAVQDDIAREIANKFRKNLSEAEHHKKLVNAPTSNMEAYKRFLRAVQLYDYADPASRKLSLELFNEAITLDPNFAYAHAWLARYYSFLGQTGAMPANRSAELTKYHGERAIAIDPQNAMSLAALANSKFYNDWQWNEALELLEKAATINPNEPMVYLTRAEVRIALLEYQEGRDDMAKAFQLDPLSAEVAIAAARINMVSGKLEKADEYCSEAEKYTRNNMQVSNIRAYITGFKGDWLKASELFENLNKLAGDFPVILLGLAYSYEQLGNKKGLYELLDRIQQLQLQHKDNNFDFLLLMIYSYLGDVEKMDLYYAYCIEKKLMWAIMFYGTPFMKRIQQHEPIVSERKRLGLPVIA